MEIKEGQENGQLILTYLFTDEKANDASEKANRSSLAVRAFYLVGRKPIPVGPRRLNNHPFL
jgi:hypothetical protein